MAYTVGASGTLNWTDAYITINGTKHSSAGVWTFDTKPTVSVYVTAAIVNYRSYCYVTLNGETVQSGYGEYNLETDDDVINIVFSQGKVGNYVYYIADITTSKTDPMAPKDGSNTNIGGVAFQIGGGTARFGGVAYEIDSGMARVGGVAMELSLSLPPCTITITGTGHKNICYALIGGTKYYTAKTLEIASGAEITFHSQIKTSSSAGSVKAGSISVNGTKVNGTEQNYVYTIKRNIAVKLSYTSNSDGTYSSNITITES